jgi:hypothetical protein
VSQDRANELYGQWGGIVRFVLAKSHDQYSQQLLKEAVGKCEAKDIMSYDGTEATPDHLSHKLMHLIVDDTGLVRYFLLLPLICSSYCW